MAETPLPPIPEKNIFNSCDFRIETPYANSRNIAGCNTLFRYIHLPANLIFLITFSSSRVFDLLVMQDKINNYIT